MRMKRKEMKRDARSVFKLHYFVFVAICLVAAYLGSEFYDSLGRLGSPWNTSFEYEAYTVGPGGLVMTQNADTPGLGDVIERALEGEEEEGRRLSGQLEQQAIEASKEGPAALGRSRGVFAKMMNAVTSGPVFVTVISAVNRLVGSPDITMAIFWGCSLILPFLAWFFLENMYIVISRRLFLESRIYEKMPAHRFLFLFRVRRWTKTAWTMFVVSIFKVLWMFTIVGYFIKYYSYYMVPYIVAENPDIDTLDAINLSKKMMRGHKWECFVFELSFIGWDFFGALTMGISEILYSNPYRVSAFCEYYVRLRDLAKKSQMPGSELLNDHYLYMPPDRQTINQVYADVVDIMEKPVQTVQPLKGVKGFLSEWFGICFSKNGSVAADEEVRSLAGRIADLKDEVWGQAYPGRLFTIPDRRKTKKSQSLHYMRYYTVCSLILMFFIFSLGGWLWEVSFHMINYGEFVKRGVLHGPWLPIYGSGAVLMLTVLKKLRNHPVKEFWGIIFLCGAVEYLTSFILELFTGNRWWDYTGYFLNLNGRICAEGLLLFGIGGIMIVYVLAPVLDNLIGKVKKRWIIPVCIVLMCLFLTDQVYSIQNPNAGDGITANYNDQLE